MNPHRVSMLPALLLRLRRPIVLALHLLLIPVGYYAAFSLRFDFRPPQPYVDLFWRTVPYLAALVMAFVSSLPKPPQAREQLPVA